MVTLLFALEHSLVGMAIWMCLSVAGYSAYLYLIGDDETQ